jgi:hypothetical protein
MDHYGKPLKAIKVNIEPEVIRQLHVMAEHEDRSVSSAFRRVIARGLESMQVDAGRDRKQRSRSAA